MKARGLLVGLAVALLLAAGVAWWLYTYERVAIDVPMPPRGEARYNPYYGLKKALQAYGLDVDARAGLDLAAAPLAARDTLLFGADVRTLGAAQASALLDWVDAGGELVVGLPSSDEGRAGDLLDALGVQPRSGVACHAWPAGADAQARATTCTHVLFHLDEDAIDGFEALVGDAENGYVFGRVASGDGHVTIVGDLGVLRNARLGQDGIAAFAWQLVGPALTGGKVRIVYAADVPPLHVLLVKHGWPALLPALLALLAWLWWRGQRYGPLLPASQAPRRALGEHIAAAGEFQFRRGRAFALYAPVRRRFDERLRRDEPALAALDGVALVGALAQRARRTPAEIRLALEPTQLVSPDQFLAAIRLLTELEARP